MSYHHSSFLKFCDSWIWLCSREVDSFIHHTIIIPAGKPISSCLPPDGITSLVWKVSKSFVARRIIFRFTTYQILGANTRNIRRNGSFSECELRYNDALFLTESFVIYSWTLCSFSRAFVPSLYFGFLQNMHVCGNTTDLMADLSTSRWPILTWPCSCSVLLLSAVIFDGEWSFFGLQTLFSTSSMVLH